jgi:hypothetical protein
MARLGALFKYGFLGLIGLVLVVVAVVLGVADVNPRT